MDISYDNVKEKFKAMINEIGSDDIIEYPSSSSFPEEKDDNDGSSKNPFSSSQKTKTSSNSKTPVLDNFGRDITLLAEKDQLDPVIGRDKEIQRVSQILSRRKKNNPLLIGEPGVGKSAIAEGLALRIIQKKVSRVLYGKRVITLAAFILVIAGFISNLYWDFTVEEFIFSGVMYIVIAGLGITGAEKFVSNKKNN